jgi:hypothetical protein
VSCCWVTLQRFRVVGRLFAAATTLDSPLRYYRYPHILPDSVGACLPADYAHCFLPLNTVWLFLPNGGLVLSAVARTYAAPLPLTATTTALRTLVYLVVETLYRYHDGTVTGRPFSPPPSVHSPPHWLPYVGDYLDGWTTSFWFCRVAHCWLWIRCVGAALLRCYALLLHLAFRIAHALFRLPFTATIVRTGWWIAIFVPCLFLLIVILAEFHRPDRIADRHCI